MKKVDYNLFRKIADENRTNCGRRLIRKSKLISIYFNETGYLMSEYEYNKNADKVHSEDYHERIKNAKN